VAPAVAPAYLKNERRAMGEYSGRSWSFSTVSESELILVDIREKEEKKKTIMLWISGSQQEVTYSVIELKILNVEADFSRFTLNR
jgi:hypothetical protein